METVIDLLKAVELNMLEFSIASIFIFSLGYYIARKKVKRLNFEMYKLQKEILELNEELLYGTHEAVSETPVIGLKHDSLKQPKLAR